jgi:hypothetical protein
MGNVRRRSPLKRRALDQSDGGSQAFFNTRLPRPLLCGRARSEAPQSPVFHEILSDSQRIRQSVGLFPRSGVLAVSPTVQKRTDGPADWLR